MIKTTTTTTTAMITPLSSSSSSPDVGSKTFKHKSIHSFVIISKCRRLFLLHLRIFLQPFLTPIIENLHIQRHFCSISWVFFFVCLFVCLFGIILQHISCFPKTAPNNYQSCDFFSGMPLFESRLIISKLTDIFLSGDGVCVYVA